MWRGKRRQAGGVGGEEVDEEGLGRERERVVRAEERPQVTQDGFASANCAC